MYSVKKEFTFDAAHRLMDYKGLCSNPHGHTYRAIIEIEGGLRNDMVLDFKEFSKIKNRIDEIWDHAFLLNSEDLKLVNFCRKNGFRFFAFEGNPTAENMAKLIFDIAVCFVVGVTVKSVELFETPTCSAKVTHV